MGMQVEARIGKLGLGLGFSIESMFVGAAGNGRKSLRSSLELLY